jgi:MFS family permease
MTASGFMADLGRAFKHRDYRLFFSGQLVSLIGTWIQMTAQAWLVYRLSGSALYLGLASFASQGPVFLIAQLGGAVADRYDRRRILVTTQVVSMILALILAWLTMSGQVQLWHVFLLATLTGLTNAFDIPTRQSFVVDMVGRADLQNAIALNSSMFNMARLVGPALAGVIVAAVGEGWCFLINGISFLMVIGCLLAMHRPAFVTPSQKDSLLAQMRQGLSYASTTRPIRYVLLLVGLMSLMGMPYTVLMPIFANKILQGGPLHLGALMSAAGFGALLAALRLAARKTLDGIEKRIAWAVVGFGLFLVLFALSEVFWLSLVLLVLVGFCQMTHMASSNTLIQSMVPDRYRGRVMALYSMMFMGMAPFGALISGLLAGAIGAPSAVIFGAVASILGGQVFMALLPSLRPEMTRLIVEGEAAGKTT